MIYGDDSFSEKSGNLDKSGNSLTVAEKAKGPVEVLGFFLLGELAFSIFPLNVNAIILHDFIFPR